MSINPSEFREFALRFDRMTRADREELLDRLERRHVALHAHQSGRSVLDGFKERGLLGSIKDAPPDLSTNPAYMEGFGQDEQ